MVKENQTTKIEVSGIADTSTQPSNGNGDDEGAKYLYHKNATVPQLLLAIWKRFLELIIKLLGLKGLILVLDVYLIIDGKVPAWTFLVVAGIVLGGRMSENLIDKVIGNNK